MKLSKHVIAIAILTLAGAILLFAGEFVPFADSLESNRVNETLRQKILGRTVSVEDLRQEFKDVGRLEAGNIISMLVSNRDRADIVALVKEIWSGSELREPEFDWETLKTDYVRVNAALFLSQTTSADESEDYKKYIRSELLSSDDMVRLAASIAIAIVGDSSDIPKLAEIVKSDSYGPASSAATAISMIGGNQSRETLEQILAEDNLGANMRTHIKKLLDN